MKYACSEEVPEPVDLQGDGFSVAFDPLDGSSIVDTNFTVGTIFGVWPGDKLKGITGREQARCPGMMRSDTDACQHHAARHWRAASCGHVTESSPSRCTTQCRPMPTPTRMQGHGNSREEALLVCA